jgi:hypothetical protein
MKSVPQWLKPSSKHAFTAQSKTTFKPFRTIMGESEWFSSPWVSRRLMGTRLNRLLKNSVLYQGTTSVEP